MRKRVLSSLATGALLAACSPTSQPLTSTPFTPGTPAQSQTSPASQTPEQTPSQAQNSTQTVLPSVTHASFNNQPETLADRVESKDQPIKVQADGFHKQDIASAMELTLVAEVAPPKILGKNVQATDVQVQGNYAYVSYDIAGPEFSGGVYILDVKDPKNPKLVAEMTAPDLDAYALMPQGKRLYFSGASANEKLLKTPALLQSFELSEDGSRFVKDLGTTGLPSYAGTDVAVSQGKIYVSSGDKGGGISLIDPDSLQSKAFFPFEDARSVNTNYTLNGKPQVVAFKGTTGALQVLDADLNAGARYNFASTATIQYSQSIMEVQDSLALIGAGDGGGILVDLATGKLLSQQKPPQGITNGATLSGELAFLANGEDGVSVALRGSNGSLEPVGSLAFPAQVSSNTVMYRNNVLYVANGRGGLSILTVKASPPNPCRGTAENIVANPGFELPNDALSSYIFTKDVPCWNVVGSEGVAEIDPPSVWTTPDGVRSMDLNPNSPGAIAQTLQTTVGKPYRLSFSLAGNYTVAPAKKEVEIFWNGKSLGTQTFDTSGRSGSNMGWKTVTLDLPAPTAAQTELRFNGKNTGSGGPVIDAVKVEPVTNLLDQVLNILR